jgi:inner membrane protein involved in colicin E2 resistance
MNRTLLRRGVLRVCTFITVLIAAHHLGQMEKASWLDWVGFLLCGAALVVVYLQLLTTSIDESHV